MPGSGDRLECRELFLALCLLPLKQIPFFFGCFFVAVSVETWQLHVVPPKPRSCAFLALRLRPGQELFSLFLLFRNALLGIQSLEKSHKFFGT